MNAIAEPAAAKSSLASYLAEAGAGLPVSRTMALTLMQVGDT